MSDPTPAAAPAAEFSKDDKAWIDLLEEAFIGDVIACISIAKALATDGGTPPEKMVCDESVFAFDLLSWTANNKNNMVSGSH